MLPTKCILFPRISTATILKIDLLKTTELLLLLCCVHHVWLFASPWTVAQKAPLSMGFPRQKYWSGLPFPSAGDFSDPGMEPSSLASPELAGGFFTTSTKAHYYYNIPLIGLLPTYVSWPSIIHLKVIRTSHFPSFKSSSNFLLDVE